MSSNADNGIALQRTEVHSIAPIGPGQLVTGVSLQTSGIHNVSVVGKVQLRRTYDAALRKQRAALAAAEKELAAAQAAYDAQVKTLVIDNESRLKALRLVEELRHFYPTVVLTLATRNGEAGPLPPSTDFPATDIRVNAAAKTYEATLHVNLHRGDALELSRTILLPERVLKAQAVVDAARAKIAEVDVKIRDLAGKKANINQQVEEIEAIVLRRQLDAVGGSPYLDDMDAFTDMVMEACGVSKSDLV